MAVVEFDGDFVGVVGDGLVGSLGELRCHRLDGERLRFALEFLEKDAPAFRGQYSVSLGFAQRCRAEGGLLDARTLEVLGVSHGFSKGVPGIYQYNRGY